MVPRMSSRSSSGCTTLLLTVALVLLTDLIGQGSGQLQRPIPCPLRCLCFRTTVRCMFLEFERIPPIPSNTTILDLRFNKIKDIAPNSLANARDLNTLLLNNNQITRLQNGAFNGLRELRHLYLYKNRIREIEAKAFHGLNKLEQLYIHFNELVHLQKGTFSNLPALERLYIHYNKIEKIYSGVFSDLSLLERLFLQHNKLQRIPTGAFKNMVSLKRLRLDSNALVCDCEMVWLVRMLKDQMKGTQAAATCQEPLAMQGRPLAAITEDDFRCRKPEITEQPHDVELTFGGTVYFSCKADGDPQPDIVWLRNSNEVSYTDPRYSMLRDGTLMIENTLLEDVGVFECMAKSPAGESKSRSAVMRLPGATEKPRFVRVPQDTQSAIGREVVLRCEAAGQPPPEVTWTRDNRLLHIPSQRMRMASNGTLVISGALREDSGNYRCTASNYLGRIHATAQLKVNGAPHLIVVPFNETVSPGGSAQFRCVAEGQPNPTINWYREGQLVPPGGNVRIVANGQILRIEKVKSADTGQYTCSAKNSAGRVIAGAWLSVTSERREAPVLQDSPYDMTVPYGATIEIPCRAQGNPNPTIHWRKDDIPVDEDIRHRVSSGGSLYLYNVSREDTGKYECFAVNENGQVSAKGRLDVEYTPLMKNRVQSSNRRSSSVHQHGTAAAYVAAASENSILTSPGDRFVQRAFLEAERQVDRAVNDTLTALFSRTTPASPGELLRIIRYPNAEARQIARAAEIYEVTLANVRRHVLAGMRLNLTGNDFSYRELLSPPQLELVANLSGCMAHRRSVSCDDMCFHAKYRSLDGSCNNLHHPMWGASLTAFDRLLPPEYENGFNTPIGWTKDLKYFGYPKPSARLVSSRILSTTDITPDHENSHMLMQWGQFLDHDLDHAIPSLSGESFEEGVECKGTCAFASPCYPIEIPVSDSRGRAGRCMDFTRSSAVCGSGGTSVLFDHVMPREQINQLTAFIDASQVYGFTDGVSRELRELHSQYGLLRTSRQGNLDGALPPLAERDFMDCRRDPRESHIGCFLAGDIRANEQVGLLSMHVVWLREHNRIATELRRVNPHWDPDVLFHEARKVVGAEMQHITYAHWLPHILGPEGMRQLGPYEGYDPQTEPTITNEFATAALRFGHSLINPMLERLNASFHPIPEGALPLHKAFFSPWRLVEEGGIDPLLRGLLFSPAKLKTPHQSLNSDLTERLFSAAHAVALDLAAINIQRGRDHGLPSYSEYRRFCNLSVAVTFTDLRHEIRSAAVRDTLRDLYGHPGNIDLFVGGLLEDVVEGAKVGPTFLCILVHQFKRLRAGDRLWYENPAAFKPDQLTEIRQVSLAAVLCENGDNIDRVSRDVFRLPSRQLGGLVHCSKIPRVELRVWSECCTDCTRAGRFNAITGHPVGRGRRSIKEELEEKGFTPAWARPATLKNFTQEAIIEKEAEEERVEGVESALQDLRKTLHRLRKKVKRLEENCGGDHQEEEGHGHFKRTCTDHEGRTRLNGELWRLDDCTSCHCQRHQVLCTRQACPPLTCTAPSTPQIHPGECCAVCDTPSSP